MNTTELKKLAERCVCLPVSRSTTEVENAGTAILDLLAINAELVEALKLAQKALDAIGDEMTVGERYTNAGQYLIDSVGPIKDALAKAEGGEL